MIIILQRPFLARQALFGVNATNGERVSPSASFLILGGFDVVRPHLEGGGDRPERGHNKKPKYRMLRECVYGGVKNPEQLWTLLL